MAISTDSYTNLQVGGVTVSKIGFSKTLNNYSLSEIADFSYAAYCHHMIKYPITGSNNTIYAVTNETPIPMKVVNNNGTVTLTAGTNAPYANNQGQYGKIMWLSGANKAFALTQNDFTNVKVVTEWDASHMVFELDTPQTVSINGVTYGGTKWDGSDMTEHPLWFANWGTVYWYNNNTGSTKIATPVDIQPYMYTEINGDPVMLLITPRLRQFLTNNNYNTTGGAETAKRYNSLSTPLSWDFSFAVSALYSASYTPETFPYTFYWGSTGQYGYQRIVEGYPDDHVMGHLFLGGSFNSLYEGFQIDWYFTDRDDIYKLYMGCGIKFKGDKVYKPIIHNGYIEGYTDDLTTPSDIDNWDGTAKHDVPITPPPPSPTGDNENEEIEMPLAYIGGTGGFVQFIKINSAGLASADDISAALSRFDITLIGKDLLRNFVSYKCFAVLNIDPTDTVTRQITVDGHGLTDENDTPLQGQVIGSVLPIDFTIGTAERYFNDFRDYAPYTKLEAYVPFCGWFTLPSWCIGRKITGTMFTDLYNGTVKAVIYANNTVVAEIGGCCAYDIPFVADATGAKAGAVISSALSTAAATAATVTMPNVATGISAVTSAANTICAVNSNDTTLKGVLGDGSNLNGLLHCYLKITRPQSPTRNKTIPDTYKHEFGIPTYKAITLAAGDGYTQIMDAKVEGSMTDREKQMIIDGFKHGLIL